MELNLPMHASKWIFKLECMPLMTPHGYKPDVGIRLYACPIDDGYKFRLLNVINGTNRETLRMECGN